MKTLKLKLPVVKIKFLIFSLTWNYKVLFAFSVVLTTELTNIYWQQFSVDFNYSMVLLWWYSQSIFIYNISTSFNLSLAFSYFSQRH